MNFLNRFSQQSLATNTSPLPELHLDGRILRASFENMVKSAEKLGGIEIIIDGLNGKSILFQSTFSDRNTISFESDFYSACAFMPTVRRRLKFALEKHGFSLIWDSIQQLLDEVTIENADNRIEQFFLALATSKRDRWVRDLAAEILHFCDPDKFPLMTRWIWDFSSNTGVLREIWFTDNDHEQIKVPNGIQTHLELRRELLGFLKDCGVFANQNLTIDVLFAWIYSEYIGSQGGSFLRTEFNASGQPFGYALRMLGLDTAYCSGKTRLLLPGGKRYQLAEPFVSVAH